MGVEGPRHRHTMAERRRISPHHLARLRAIVQELGSLTTAREKLGVGHGVIEDALTAGGFRPATIDRLEAAIDALLDGAPAAERGKGAA